MLFYAQFHSTPRTVAFFIQIPCSEVNQIGNNVADIGTHVGDLDFNNYFLWLFPTPGLIPERVIAFYRFPILFKFSLCTLDGHIGQFMQLTVPAQSGNKTGIVLCFAPLHKINRGKMPVAPDNDHPIGPLLSDMTNDLLQQGSNIVLFTPSTRFQNGGDQLTLE